MPKKILMIFFLIAFIMFSTSVHQTQAGGAGGEALISDEVGWGLVAVTAAFLIYIIWQSKQSKNETDTSQIPKTNSSIEESLNLFKGSQGLALIKW